MTAERRTYTIDWIGNGASYIADYETGLVLHNELTGSYSPDDILCITRFDVAEYRRFWAARGEDYLADEWIDPLDVGFWHINKDGVEVYETAESEFRYEYIIGQMDEARSEAGGISEIWMHPREAEKIVSLDLETTKEGPKTWSVCHDVAEVTHFSIYARIPDPETGFEEAHALTDIPLSRGSAAALQCALKLSTLLQVPLHDNRQVLRG